MREVKYYCDVCGEEVDSEEHLHKLEVIFDVSTYNFKDDVCMKCRENFRIICSNFKNNRKYEFK